MGRGHGLDTGILGVADKDIMQHSATTKEGTVIPSLQPL